MRLNYANLQPWNDNKRGGAARGDAFKDKLSAEWHVRMSRAINFPGRPMCALSVEQCTLQYARDTLAHLRKMTREERVEYTRNTGFALVDFEKAIENQMKRCEVAASCDMQKVFGIRMELKEVSERMRDANDTGRSHVAGRVRKSVMKKLGEVA